MIPTRRAFLRGAAGGLASLALPPAVARAAAVVPAASGFSAAHRVLDDAVAVGGHVGAVLAIVRGGRVVDWHVAGHADVARTRRLRRDAIFRIQSMSKPIASAAALMLVESGALRLDDPVSRHVPAFADVRVVHGGSVDAPLLRAPSRPPTVRDLLSHKAGLPAGLPGDDVAAALLERTGAYGADRLQAFADRLARAPLAADPGTRFGYDGVATELLSRVVEVASGRRFATFVQARILRPLGMADTGFEVPASKRDRIVELSTVDGMGRVVPAAASAAPPAGERMRRWDSGAGGLYSTAADYARFAGLLLGGGTLDGTTLLAPGTVRLMATDQLAALPPARARPGTGEGFGLGVGIVVDPAARGGDAPAGTFGWTGAMSTAFSIDPSHGLAIVLMQQYLPVDGGRGLRKPWRTVQDAVQAAVR